MVKMTEHVPIKKDNISSPYEDWNVEIINCQKKMNEASGHTLENIFLRIKMGKLKLICTYFTQCELMSFNYQCPKKYRQLTCPPHTQCKLNMSKTYEYAKQKDMGVCVELFHRRVRTMLKALRAPYPLMVASISSQIITHPKGLRQVCCESSILDFWVTFSWNFSWACYPQSA